MPPTVWIHAEPAKSTKPNCASQPLLFHTHPASIGYTTRLIRPLYIQYEMNFVLSAIAPETIVAAVAQNTRLKTNDDHGKLLKSVNI